MGGSSKGTTKNYERELSPQELRLLETQNQMMQQGINIAQQQDDRSQSMYSDWKNNYQGIETGEMKPSANRANGYSNNPDIKTKADYGQYQSKREELQKRIDKLKSERSRPHSRGGKGSQNMARQVVSPMGAVRMAQGANTTMNRVMDGRNAQPEMSGADRMRALKNMGSFKNNIFADQGLVNLDRDKNSLMPSYATNPRFSSPKGGR